MSVIWEIRCLTQTVDKKGKSKFVWKTVTEITSEHKFCDVIDIMYNITKNTGFKNIRILEKMGKREFTSNIFLSDLKHAKDMEKIDER